MMEKLQALLQFNVKLTPNGVAACCKVSSVTLLSAFKIRSSWARLVCIHAARSALLILCASCHANHILEDNTN